MQILLWQTIEKVGKRGDIVDVKDGFARNYLIPRRMASLPTPGQYREFELDKRRQDQIEVQLGEGARQVEAFLEEPDPRSLLLSGENEAASFDRSFLWSLGVKTERDSSASAGGPETELDS